MWQDTISNSVVWLRYPSSGPPVVFFLIFFSASIIPSGYLMIPQVKANRVWDGYSGEAKVCFNVFFRCKLERSHCLIKPESCFFIPNQHVPSRCFSIRRSSLILERLSFLVFQDLLCWIHAFFWNGTAKNVCSLEFLPSASLSSWCFRPRWSPRRKYPCWIWMTVSLIPWLNGKIKSAFGSLCRISAWIKRLKILLMSNIVAGSNPWYKS